MISVCPREMDTKKNEKDVCFFFFISEIHHLQVYKHEEIKIYHTKRSHSAYIAASLDTVRLTLVKIFLLLTFKHFRSF